MWKIEKCPVCGYPAIVFFRKNLKSSDYEKAYKEIKSSVAGFLYCHINPHPDQKSHKEIWHIISDGRKAIQ